MARLQLASEMFWRMGSTHFSGMGDASYPNLGLSPVTSLCQLPVKVTQNTCCQPAVKTMNEGKPHLTAMLYNIQTGSPTSLSARHSMPCDVLRTCRTYRPCRHDAPRGVPQPGTLPYHSVLMPYKHKRCSTTHMLHISASDLSADAPNLQLQWYPQWGNR